MMRSFKKRGIRLPLFAPLFLSLLLLGVGCGGGGGDEGGGGGGGGGSDSNQVSRVVITPGAVLFTGTNQSKTLSAKVFNAAGDEIDTWRSTSPVNNSIDEDGQITSLSQAGSSSIIAEAGGVESEPLIVVSATLADPDTIIVKDSNVVSMRLVDPDAPLSEDTLYQVTLTGIGFPEFGDLLLGTEEAPVYGRVVDAVSDGTSVTVTLEIPPVDEMFSYLVIDETIDLSQIEPQIPDAVSRLYDVERQSDGTLIYTLKENFAAINAVNLNAGLIDDFMEIFKCEGNIEVELLPLTMSIVPELDLIVAYDSSTKFADFRIKGSMEAVIELKFVLGTLDPKLSCMAELFEPPIPLAGPLSWILGPSIPMGTGFEVSGKATFFQLGYTLKGKMGGKVEAGFTCPENENCYSVSSYEEPVLELYGEPSFPDLDNLAANIRLEPSVFVFGFFKLRFGLARYIRNWLKNQPNIPMKFDGFVAKNGGKMGFNLATVPGQILDEFYKSSYTLSYDFVVGAATDTQLALDFLIRQLHIKLEALKLEFKVSKPLSNCPTAEGIMADTYEFDEGETVTFAVKLNPAHVNFLPFVYNVNEIRIYDRGYRLLTSIDAVKGQLDFSLDWVADYDGEVYGNLYAFVVTTLPSIDYLDGLGALELGVVEGIEDDDEVDPQDPQAHDTSVTTEKNTPVGIVLTGSDKDGDELAFIVVSGPSNGSLGGSPPELTYTPNTDFVGSDAFTFKVNDGEADSSLATVSITVKEPDNTAPVADDQLVTTDQDTPVNIILSGSDEDGDDLTYEVTGQPTHGTISGLGANLTYTPTSGFSGSDVFTFIVNDGTTDSASATVTVTVTPSITMGGYCSFPLFEWLCYEYGPGFSFSQVESICAWETYDGIHFGGSPGSGSCPAGEVGRCQLTSHDNDLWTDKVFYAPGIDPDKVCRTGTWVPGD